MDTKIFSFCTQSFEQVQNRDGTSEINVMKQHIDRHIRTLVLWSTDMTKIYDYHVSGNMQARK